MARFTLDERAIAQIKLARKRVGLSQAALGELLGVTQVTVARWETGVYAVDEATLDAMCKALGLGWEAGRVEVFPLAHKKGPQG